VLSRENLTLIVLVYSPFLAPTFLIAARKLTPNSAMSSKNHHCAMCLRASMRASLSHRLRVHRTYVP